MNKQVRIVGSLRGAILVSLTTLFGARAESQRPPLHSADSVVLERTLCLGSCPAYRLSLTRSGQVSFESRNPGDLRSAKDSIEAIHFERIIANALGLVEFLKLPDRISDDPRFCPTRWTDADTVTITVFMETQMKSVADYHGCRWAPAALRELEAYIDQATNSSRWVRPASRRKPSNTR